MSFPRYPEYKNSGFGWLGEIPNHWRTIPLWTIFRRVKRTGFVKEELLSVYRDHGVIPKSSRDDNHNRSSEDLTPYQLVDIGDLVINKMKAFQGSVAVSDYRGIVSPAYFVYEGDHLNNARFLHYLMRSSRYVFYYLSISKGIRPNQWDLDPQQHSRLPIALPPISEQKIIADFLDSHIKNINTLIAEEEKLIELLKEKRRAIIAKTVLQGLDLSVETKNSNLAWLGRLPSHWGNGKLRWLSKRYAGGTPDKTNIAFWTDGTIPWINSGSVNDQLIIEPSTYITEEAFRSSSAKWIPKGSLVIALAGQGKTKGMVAQLAIDTTCNQSMAAIIPNREISPRYLYYWIDSNYENIRNMAGGDLRDGLNLEMLGNIPCPIPDISEQESISNFLDKETYKMDNLITQSDANISLLEERRLALISAAVTGQIDVRKYEIKEAA